MADPTTEKPQASPLSLLASEAFGTEFYGSVDQTEEPVQPAEEIEETTEETGEAVEEPESQEGEEVEAEASEESESEGETISSLEELIQHQEWDPEWVNNLEVQVKVDGASGKAKLSDLVKSYQIDKAAEKRLEEAKAKAKEINQSLTEKQEQAHTQLVTAAKLIEKVEAMIDSDSKAIDWQKLREQDPAEFAAKKEDLKERRESLNRLKAEAATEYQQSVQKHQQESQEQLREYLQQQQTLLLNKLPEWKDEKTLSTEREGVTKYLLGQDFTQEELNQAYDHRFIVMARKAMKYDELQAKTEPAKKKVAKVPKVLKPGAPKPPEIVNRERRDKAIQRLRKTGSIEDAFEALKLSRSN